MENLLALLERWADKLIGPALIVILTVIVLEIFFPKFAHDYHTAILVADYAAIGVFVVDLSFKFKRAASWEGFIKEYWLEILAISPVFVVVRVFESLAFLTAGDLAQDTIHLITRSERFAALAGGSELTRSARMSSLVRGIARTPRFAKAAEFFKHPDED
jgi:hypothetical protein